MTRPSTERARWLGRTAAVAGLLAVYYVLAVSAASRKSMTFDEMAHLTAGYTYWAFNDYRLHPENGNLPQRLGALPAVLSGAAFPRLDQQAWTTSNVYAIGDQFFYSSGNDADTLLRRSRAVMALLGVALGALVYAWARRLISPAGAWVSLVLFVFSPTLLAHGPLVTSDIAAALFFTAAVGAIWVALHRVTPATVLGAGVLLAGAFLSKLSAPILLVVATVMTMVTADRWPAPDGRIPRQIRRVRETPAAGGHRVRRRRDCRTGHVDARSGQPSVSGSRRLPLRRPARMPFSGRSPSNRGVAGWVLSDARRLHLLPEAYLYGSALTVQFAAERAAFLNGQFSTTGWWWYFPYAFAVKTTIPAMIVGLLALAALVRRWRRPDAGETWRQRARASLYAGTPLARADRCLRGVRAHHQSQYRSSAPVAGLSGSLHPGWRRRVLAPAAVRADADGGAAEPSEPTPATIGAGRAERPGGAEDPPPPCFVGIATVAMLAWHVAESVTIRPDYLAYFNQLAGGPSEGYKHLADSSLDWGQDLPALKQWLDREGLQRPGAGNVYLSYFGTARPEYYGIKAIPLAGFLDRRPPQPPDPLGGGVYCISATVLDVIGPSFYKPEDESNYQAALKNLIAFARASENEAAWSALLRQTGEQYLARPVQAVRSAEDRAAGGVSSQSPARRHGRVLDPDLPADRWRRRSRGERSSPWRSPVTVNSGPAKHGKVRRTVRGPKPSRRGAGTPSWWARVFRPGQHAQDGALLGARGRGVGRRVLRERGRKRFRARRHPPHSRQPAHPIARQRSAPFCILVLGCGWITGALPAAGARFVHHQLRHARPVARRLHAP